MTCIVAFVDDQGGIHFGSDSLGTDGHFSKVISDPKIFQAGEFLFGYAGSFRLGQILEHIFIPPERLENQTTKQYLCTQFIDSLKTSLKICGSLGTDDDNGDTDSFEGDFLVGYRGEIFIVQGDFAVLQVRDNHLAIGSGEETATAVLLATKELDLEPLERLQLALDTTDQLIDSVGPPFHFLSMKKAKGKSLPVVTYEVMG